MSFCGKLTTYSRLNYCTQDNLNFLLLVVFSDVNRNIQIYYFPCLQIFLGRWVVDGQRELIDKYSLKKRTYIGSTSMDAQLSFIMANLAQVQRGQIVVDPFVGTGTAYNMSIIC